MRGLSASAAGNKTKFHGPKSARARRGVRRQVYRGRRARPGAWRRWPLGWLAAPVVAALVVAWAAAVPVPNAGVTRQAFAVIGLLAGSAVLAVTPGLALLSVLARYRRLGQATALGLLYAGAGITAWVGFWAWFARPGFGAALDAAMLAVSVVLIATFGRRGDLGRFGLSLPLALALAVSVLYTGTAFLRGGPTVNPAETISRLMWPAQDNVIPMLFAAKLAAHAPLTGYLVRGGWLSSDRPPLQTGFVLLQWPLWPVAGRLGGYQFLGTVLQSAWLPALWVVFRVRGVSVGRTCAAVLAAAVTGVMYLNTLYVWPKMLAAALALAVLAILVSGDPGDRWPDDRWPWAGVLAAALAALSMLSHGGTSFGLLALAPFAYPLRRGLTARALAAGAVTAAVLYLPWMLYQHFVNPPGDRLVKWMLAGVVSIDGRGVLRAIIEQYRSLSLPLLLGNKGDNVMTLFANVGVLDGPHFAWSGSFFGSARVVGVFFLVPAAGPLLLGALALLQPSARRRLAGVKPLAAFTALTIAAWVLLLFGGQVTTVIHAGPYASLVVFIGLCALAVTALPPVLRGAVLVASVAWFAVEWVPGLTFRQEWTYSPASSSADWSMVIVCGCALTAVIALTTAACRSAVVQAPGGSAIMEVPTSLKPSLE
jgi:hypothetical protein